MLVYTPKLGNFGGWISVNVLFSPRSLWNLLCDGDKGLVSVCYSIQRSAILGSVSLRVLLEPRRQPLRMCSQMEIAPLGSSQTLSVSYILADSEFVSEHMANMLKETVLDSRQTPTSIID